MLVAHDVEVSVSAEVRLLGPVSLQVAAGSLVALMGASGSGKSTFMHVLAGIAEPTSGTAVWATEETTAAVQALGYVPQRESVHDRLTTREALHYAASLRLGAGAATEARVDTVLRDLGLTGQADTQIKQLSGGERRRAACGLELVGDPPVLLLDEPTSGLDTVLERRLMHLFRRLADQGRAVLVATHATASLDLCDEVIILQSGLIAFRGPPAEGQRYLASVAHDAQRLGDGNGSGPLSTSSEQNPAASSSGETIDAGPADRMAPKVGAAQSAKRSFGLELRVLTSRYGRTLTRDRRTLALLIGQAPVIGILIALVFHTGALSPTASPLNAIDLVFLLMTGSVWLGVSSACREVVKERGLVEREFDVGVRLDAYVAAKAVVLFALNFVQIALLVLVVVGLQPLGVGAGGVVELLAIAVLTAWASAAMGLAVSCVARSVDQAAGAVPLLLMPQLLLAGGVIPLAQMPGPARALANLIYSRWSYEGLSSAARIGARLAGYPSSSALGFDAGSFSLSVGAAAAVLVAFTIGGLIVAVFSLTVRPALER